MTQASGSSEHPRAEPADATRELRSLTAAAEKRLLLWLAARMPARVNSDHLTALGLLAMMAAGTFYWLSRRSPWLLHIVNLSLVLNWFGDSLDGTLARHRNRSRPRYGFYVDHMVDAYGALCLVGGLGLSGLMSPGMAVAVLIAYYLLNIHIYLAAYSVGVFKIAYGRLGGTELRILLVILNLAALRQPWFSVSGARHRIFDVCGAVAVAGITAALLVATVRTARTLAERERLPG